VAQRRQVGQRQRDVVDQVRKGAERLIEGAAEVIPVNRDHAARADPLHHLSPPLGAVVTRLLAGASESEEDRVCMSAREAACDVTR